MKDWSVALPKKITKQIEKEVINQNINLQTAITEALELWLNTPTVNPRKIRAIEQEDFDVMEMNILKQCPLVDRDCLMDNCRAWDNNDCSIIDALQLYLRPTNPKNTLGFSGDNFVIPNEGINLVEFMKSIEKKIIESAMDKVRGSKTKAAQLLSVSFDSLRYRIESLNIEDKK
jgi:DNA-binding NtrC family response regulator